MGRCGTPAGAVSVKALQWPWKWSVGLERRPGREEVVRDEIQKVVMDQTAEDSVGHREGFLHFIVRAVKI